MTQSVQEFLDTFDQFPDSVKREALSELLMRVKLLDFGSPSDEELVANAEELFLELDRREAADGRP